MGRGDRKTKKGKIWRGSSGNSRPKKKNIIPTDDDTKKSADDAKKSDDDAKTSE